MIRGNPQRRRAWRRAAAGEKSRKQREHDQLVFAHVVLVLGLVLWVVVTYFIRF